MSHSPKTKGKGLGELHESLIGGTGNPLQADVEAGDSTSNITQETLDSINVPQSKTENKLALEKLGGIVGLTKSFGVNLQTGLNMDEVIRLRKIYGNNIYPESPMDSYLQMLFDALSDTTLLILIAAAAVSLGIGIYQHGAQQGWHEGGAIFIAVFLVSNIAALNDYTKQLQFRELEKASAQDERCSVFREGQIQRINPEDLVIGDTLVFQAGDQIPADCVLIDNSKVKCNESSLTGEVDDVKKSINSDCFLLSSTLITDGDECRAMVIGIGIHSQWGKIKSNLVTEAVNTPLQDKLEEMTNLIGYIGMGFAFMTFCALFISIWTRDGGNNIADGVLDAFILAVTIVVVAIPEGLPLAVTIALAYSSKKMYNDQCFIRILAACETMGNATTICSDKTGTLTENRMTVVEGWFGDVVHDQNSFGNKNVSEEVKVIVGEHVCINRTAYLVYKDAEGNMLDRPTIVGSKTEGALIMMAKRWGLKYDQVKQRVFHEATDKLFPFDSNKKRSTAVVHRSDGKVRLFCKGASEVILADCTHYLSESGAARPMTEAKRTELSRVINTMADNALRTLVLAHRDFVAGSAQGELPGDWTENPPDNGNLCCDCIVGIMDPLRGDIKQAVATAQQAGIVVRMITGDNIATASAIARQCGILTAGGVALEGPKFRDMTPKALDAVLPRLQVLARSSPNDKFLLVSRLNGYNIPEDKEQWENKHTGRPGITWEDDRDKILPGYKEEWEVDRPEGGQVVGVTGDGTNDAPALKAADVGLSMGITGTKVAQAASDIVILDDKFGSIVNSILWGRAVYDNIRKFLQFQLTVNVVALILVFIGAAAGFGQPLTAVQMLWVNLVMDTLGALALGTEAPNKEVLNRKPYKRSASLVSRPMWRNILCQSAYQLIILFTLMFAGPTIFGIKGSSESQEVCAQFSVDTSSTVTWDAYTGLISLNPQAPVTCANFAELCSGGTNAPRGEQSNSYCLEDTTWSVKYDTGAESPGFVFNNLQDFKSTCLTCETIDYTMGAIIFNAFIWCQLFNEFGARSILDEINFFAGLQKNWMFLYVSLIQVALQIVLIEEGGFIVKTAPLSLYEWLLTIMLGAMSLPISVLMRFIPISEDPDSFFHHDQFSSK